MKLKITIDDKQYEADIEVLDDERVEAGGAGSPRPVRQRAVASTPLAAADAAPASPAVGDEKFCKSSIVGIVVKVLVSAGQSVKQGELLLVLEAMKMESNVASPVSGVVKSVQVEVGSSVKKGQVLVEFE